MDRAPMKSHRVHVLNVAIWRLAKFEGRHPARFGLQTHQRALQVHVHWVNGVIRKKRAIGGGHTDPVVVDLHGFPNGIWIGQI